MARLLLTSPLDIRVLEQGLSVGEALAAFNAAYPQAGAIVSFTGKVRRDDPGSESGGASDSVKALELTHYEPLTLPGMQDIAAQARERWALDGALAWHRVGIMRPGDAIVLVATAARHRRGAFEAADFIMDHLKSAAWFWKREKRESGWHWIEPRDADFADRERWS